MGEDSGSMGTYADLATGLSTTVGGLAMASSASSTMPVSFCLRTELDEEAIEAEAACRRQAEDKAPSVNSDAAANTKMVSWGENLSATD
jgi:hypothetical protein